MFLSSESVCKAVQDYVFLSKYNLKRNTPNHKNVITFVCTCNSQNKTTIPKFKQNKLNEQSVLDESFFDNSSTITSPGLPISQISSSQMLGTFSDEIDNALEQIFLSQKRTKPKGGQIKCIINQPCCTFRLKFIQNELTKTFQFCSTTFPLHNHPPAKLSTKVSVVNYIFIIFYMIYILNCIEF